MSQRLPPSANQNLCIEVIERGEMRTELPGGSSSRLSLADTITCLCKALPGLFA